MQRCSAFMARTGPFLLELTIEGLLNVIVFPVNSMIFVLCQSLALNVLKAHFLFMSGFILFYRPT